MSKKISHRPPRLQDQPPSSRAEVRAFSRKKGKKTGDIISSTFTTVDTSLRTLVKDAKDTSQRLAKSARVFTHTVRSDIETPNVNFVQAIENGLVDAAVALRPRLDFATLVQESDDNLKALHELSQAHPEVKKFIALAEAQHQGLLAAGLTSAVWDYQHDPDAAVQFEAQTQALGFADTLFLHSRQIEPLLLAYQSVGRDVVKIRQTVQRNADIINGIATPSAEPGPITGFPTVFSAQRPIAAESPFANSWADLATSLQVTATISAHISNTYFEPLLKETDEHILGMVKAAHHNETTFKQDASLGFAHDRIGNPKQALTYFNRAREMFRNDRVKVTDDALDDEIHVLSDISKLSAPNDPIAKRALGEASGLIDWLGQKKPDAAVVYRIANMRALAALAINDYAATLSAHPSDPSAADRFHHDTITELQGIMNYCARVKNKNSAVMATVHGELLDVAAEQFESKLNAAMGLRLRSEGEDAAATYTQAEIDFTELHHRYAATASRDLADEAAARVRFASATYSFKTGDIDQSLRDLTALRTHYADTRTGMILHNAPDSLWIKQFGIVDDNGNLTSRIGVPSFRAALKKTADTLLSDKTKATKAMMAGAGVAVIGAATADAFFGTHVIGAETLGGLTLGKIGLIGAGAGLAIERGQQLLSGEQEISAAYRSGIANITTQDLEQRGKALATEVGICFIAGGAARYVRSGFMLLGADAEVPLLQGLMSEAGHVAEGVSFHEFSGALHGHTDRSALAYFNSFMTLRTLGAVSESNVASLLFPGEAWADGVMRQGVNSALANIPLQAFETATSGRLSKFGDDYFGGLFDLYAISMGGKVPEAVMHAPAYFAQAKDAFKEHGIQNQVDRLQAMALSEQGIQSDLQYAETPKERMRLSAQLADVMDARVKALQTLAKRGLVPQAEADDYVAGVAVFTTTVRAALKQESLPEKIKAVIRSGIAEYHPASGPILMLVPMRRRLPSGITMLRTGVPGIPDLPLNASYEQRAPIITQWVQRYFQTGDAVQHSKIITNLGRSYRAWGQAAQDSANALLNRLAAGTAHIDDFITLRNQLTSEYAIYKDLLAAISTRSQDSGTQKLTDMIRRSVVQVPTTVMAGLDFIADDIHSNTPPDIEEYRQLFTHRTDTRGNIFPPDIHPSALNHEAARTLVAWLSARAEVVSSDHGTTVWEGAATESARHGSGLDGQAWPPNPKTDPVLAGMLRFLGWSMDVQTVGDHILVQLHTEVALDPLVEVTIQKYTQNWDPAHTPPEQSRTALLKALQHITSKAGIVAYANDPSVSKMLHQDHHLAQELNSLPREVATLFAAIDRLPEALRFSANAGEGVVEGYLRKLCKDHYYRQQLGIVLRLMDQHTPNAHYMERYGSILESAITEYPVTPEITDPLAHDKDTIMRRISGQIAGRDLVTQAQAIVQTAQRQLKWLAAHERQLHYFIAAAQKGTITEKQRKALTIVCNELIHRLELVNFSQKRVAEAVGDEGAKQLAHNVFSSIMTRFSIVRGAAEILRDGIDQPGIVGDVSELLTSLDVSEGTPPPELSQFQRLFNDYLTGFGPPKREFSAFPESRDPKNPLIVAAHQFLSDHAATTDHNAPTGSSSAAITPSSSDIAQATPNRLGVVGLKHGVDEFPDPKRSQTLPAPEFDSPVQFAEVLQALFPADTFSSSDLHQRDTVIERIKPYDQKPRTHDDKVREMDLRFAMFTKGTDFEMPPPDPPPPTATYSPLETAQARSVAFTKLLEMRVSAQLRAKLGATATLTNKDLDAERNRIIAEVLTKMFGISIPVAHHPIMVSDLNGTLLLRPTNRRDYAAIDRIRGMDSEKISGGFLWSAPSTGLTVIAINPDLAEHTWGAYRHELEHMKQHLTYDSYNTEGTRSISGPLDDYNSYFLQRARGEVLSYVIQGTPPQTTAEYLTKPDNSYDYIEHDRDKIKLDDAGIATLQERHRAAVTQYVWALNDAVVTLEDHGYHPETARQTLVATLRPIPMERWPTELPKALNLLLKQPPQHDAPPAEAYDGKRPELRKWVETVLMKKNPHKYQLLQNYIMSPRIAIAPIKKELRQSNLGIGRLSELQNTLQAEGDKLQQLVEVLQLLSSEQMCRSQVLEHRTTKDTAAIQKAITLAANYEMMLGEVKTEMQNNSLTQLQSQIDKKILIHTAHGKALIQKETDAVVSEKGHRPPEIPLPRIRETDVAAMSKTDRAKYTIRLRHALAQAKSLEDVARIVNLYATFIRHGGFTPKNMTLEFLSLMDIAQDHPDWMPQLKPAFLGLNGALGPLEYQALLQKVAVAINAPQTNPESKKEVSLFPSMVTPELILQAWRGEITLKIMPAPSDDLPQYPTLSRPISPVGTSESSAVMTTETDSRIRDVRHYTLGAVSAEMAAAAARNQKRLAAQLLGDSSRDYFFQAEPLGTAIIPGTPYTLSLEGGSFESLLGLQMSLYEHKGNQSIHLGTIGFQYSDHGIEVVQYQGSDLGKAGDLGARQRFHAFSGNTDPMPWLAVTVGKILLQQAQREGKALRWIAGENVVFGYPHEGNEPNPNVHSLEDARQMTSNAAHLYDITAKKLGFGKRDSSGWRSYTGTVDALGQKISSDASNATATRALASDDVIRKWMSGTPDLSLPDLPPPLTPRTTVTHGGGGGAWAEGMLRTALAKIATQSGAIFKQLPLAKTADFDDREAARAARNPKLKAWVQDNMFNRTALAHFTIVATDFAHRYRDALNGTHDRQGITTLHDQWKIESAVFIDIAELMLQLARAPEQRIMAENANTLLYDGDFAAVQAHIEAQHNIERTTEHSAEQTLDPNYQVLQPQALPARYLADPLRSARALRGEFAQPTDEDPRAIHALVHYCQLAATGNLPESELHEAAHDLARILVNGYVGDQSPIAPHTLLAYANRLLGLSERKLTRDNRAQAKVWEDEALAGLTKGQPAPERTAMSMIGGVALLAQLGGGDLSSIVAQHGTAIGLGLAGIAVTVGAATLFHRVLTVKTTPLPHAKLQKSRSIPQHWMDRLPPKLDVGDPIWLNKVGFSYQDTYRHIMHNAFATRWDANNSPTQFNFEIDPWTNGRFVTALRGIRQEFETEFARNKPIIIQIADNNRSLFTFDTMTEFDTFMVTELQNIREQGVAPPPPQPRSSFEEPEPAVIRPIELGDLTGIKPQLYIEGVSIPREFKQGDRVEIGRDGSNNDISFPMDDLVSRTHTRITFERDGEFVGRITDLASENGTKIIRGGITTVLRDGESFKLKTGDIIQVGSHRIFMGEPPPRAVRLTDEPAPTNLMPVRFREAGQHFPPAYHPDNRNPDYIWRVRKNDATGCERLLETFRAHIKQDSAQRRWPINFIMKAKDNAKEEPQLLVGQRFWPGQTVAEEGVKHIQIAEGGYAQWAGELRGIFDANGKLIEVQFNANSGEFGKQSLNASQDDDIRIVRNLIAKVMHIAPDKVRFVR